MDKMDCWEALVDEWCAPQWRVAHNIAKEKRLKMKGVPHHLGSVNLHGYGKNWVCVVCLMIHANSFFVLV